MATNSCKRRTKMLTFHILPTNVVSNRSTQFIFLLRTERCDKVTLTKWHHPTDVKSSNALLVKIKTFYCVNRILWKLHCENNSLLPLNNKENNKADSQKRSSWLQKMILIRHHNLARKKFLNNQNWSRHAGGFPVGKQTSRRLAST